MERNKLVLIILGLCALAGGLYWWFVARAGSSGALNPESRPAYSEAGHSPAGNPFMGITVTSGVLKLQGTPWREWHPYGISFVRGNWFRLSKEQRQKLGFVYEVRRTGFLGTNRRTYWFRDMDERNIWWRNRTMSDSQFRNTFGRAWNDPLF